MDKTDFHSIIGHRNILIDCDKIIDIYTSKEDTFE